MESLRHVPNDKVTSPDDLLGPAASDVDLLVLVIRDSAGISAHYQGQLTSSRTDFTYEASCLSLKLLAEPVTT